ncbi:hypothetical protein RND81_02G230400 [Saponaria officinalis]|uniref:Uncharacterized protein n=1 Tax=Saponaria officinalis TaxID=3572 RepID=A0AAW1MTH7_SAPOF
MSSHIWLSPCRRLVAGEWWAVLDGGGDAGDWRRVLDAVGGGAGWWRRFWVAAASDGRWRRYWVVGGGGGAGWWRVVGGGEWWWAVAAVQGVSWEEDERDIKSCTIVMGLISGKPEAWKAVRPSPPLTSGGVMMAGLGGAFDVNVVGLY